MWKKSNYSAGIFRRQPDLELGGRPHVKHRGEVQPLATVKEDEMPPWGKGRSPIAANDAWKNERMELKEERSGCRAHTTTSSEER